MDLITVADIEGRFGRELTDTELVRATPLIQDVSAAIRLYTGRPFQETTATVRKVPHGGIVNLRRADITDVTAVDTIDAVAVDFTWDGLNTVTLSTVWRFDYEYTNGENIAAVDVTYTYGSDTVPQVVKSVACQVVARALGTPADQTGIQQESIGGYSYTIGSVAAAGPVGLLAAEMRALDAFRAVGGTARAYVR